MASYVSPNDAIAAAVGSAHPALSSTVSSTSEIPIQAAPPKPAVASADISGVHGKVHHDRPSRWGIAVGAIALVLAACVAVSYYLARGAAHPTAHDKPVEGLTIFAVFFVAALAIERLLEPLSNAILPKEDKKREADEAKAAAGHAILGLPEAKNDYRRLADLVDKLRAGAINAEQFDREVRELQLSGDRQHLQDARKSIQEAAASSGPDNDEAVSKALEQLKQDTEPMTYANNVLQSAAEKAEALSVRQLLRTTTFWVIATILGMVVAAMMKLYFLNTVGITAGDVWEEVLGTGLIIGAGTKPLHDLVQMMSKAGSTDVAGA